MEEVGVLFFRNLIEDEGCIPSHRIKESGRDIQYYLSWNQSTKVAIDITNEIMTARTAINLLIKLELEDLIGRIGLIVE